MSEEVPNLSHQTIKNSVYTFAAMALPVIFSIVVTPIVMHKLGVGNYGIYVVLNVIIGFLSLLDMGLIPALIKSIATHFENNSLDKLHRVINSALYIYLILSLAVSAGLFLLNDYIFTIFKVNLGAREQLSILILAGALFFVGGVRTVLGSILNGLQRYDLGSKILMWNVLFVNLAMLASVYSGGSYVALIIIQLLSTLYIILGYYYYSKKLLPEWRLRFIFDKKLVLPEIKFGGFAFVNQVLSNLLMQLDKLLLSSFMGPAVVPYYSLPGTVAQKIQDVSSSLTGALFPLSSQLSATNQAARLQSIYRRTISLMAVIAAALIFVIILSSSQILHFWLGGDFAEKSTTVLIILAVTYFFLGIFVPINNFLMGKGNVKELVVINFIMAVVDVASFLYLVPRYGLQGAAWAYLIGVLPIPFFVKYIEKNIFGLTDSLNFYSRLAGKLVLTFVASYLLLFKFTGLIINLPALLFFLLASFGFFIFIAYLTGFLSKQDFNLIHLFAKRVYANRSNN